MVSTKSLNGIVNGRIHLLTEEGAAVGCGWKPKPGGVVDLLKSDYDKEHIPTANASGASRTTVSPQAGVSLRISGPRRPQRTQSQVCLRAVFQMILWTPAWRMRRSPLRRSKDCQLSRRCRWRARESTPLDEKPFASWMQVPLALVYP